MQCCRCGRRTGSWTRWMSFRSFSWNIHSTYLQSLSTLHQKCSTWLTQLWKCTSKFVKSSQRRFKLKNSLKLPNSSFRAWSQATSFISKLLCWQVWDPRLRIWSRLAKTNSLLLITSWRELNRRWASLVPELPALPSFCCTWQPSNSVKTSQMPR